MEKCVADNVFLCDSQWEGDNPHDERHSCKGIFALLVQEEQMKMDDTLHVLLPLRVNELGARLRACCCDFITGGNSD